MLAYCMTQVLKLNPLLCHRLPEQIHSQILSITNTLFVLCSCYVNPECVISSRDITGVIPVNKGKLFWFDFLFFYCSPSQFLYSSWVLWHCMGRLLLVFHGDWRLIWVCMSNTCRTTSRPKKVGCWLLSDPFINRSICRYRVLLITWDIDEVTGNEVPGLESLNASVALTNDFRNLRFIFLERLDRTLRVSLLFQSYYRSCLSGVHNRGSQAGSGPRRSYFRPSEPDKK